MTTTQFNKIVSATGRNFQCEQTISGYYRLTCDGEIIHDDSAFEDVNGSEEDALDFFASILLEEYVPNDRKVFKFGVWRLID